MGSLVKKVGLIRGDSQYDVMRSWTLELEKGFNKLGIEVVVFDLKYHEQRAASAKFISNYIDGEKYLEYMISTQQ